MFLSLKDALSDENICEPVQFTKGQQHDCHEFIMILLQDLSGIGYFQPMAVKTEKKCLGPACDSLHKVKMLNNALH